MSDAVVIPRAFKGLFEPHRYKASWGGRGSAKSHSFATALVILAAQKPLRIVCAREIQNSLRDSVKQLIEDKIEALGLKDRFDCQDKVTLGKNGSRFSYVGMWRNPDAVKSLEGADIFWGEEASALSERSLRIIRPTMRKPGSELWFSWNPEFEHDPVDAFFRGPQGPPPDTLLMPVSHRDNPWFENSPLKAELDFDYDADPSKAEHVWGGGYVTAVDGSYYAKQLSDARIDGRIGHVGVDPLVQKRACWDIGVSDSTAIWICQFVSREIRVLDYIEAQGQPLDYYVNELRARGHGSALCVLPHDGARRDMVSAVRFEDHLAAAGFETQTVPNQGKGAAMQRVEAVRRLFPQMWFDGDRCRDGLKALAGYHERRDHHRNIGLGPEHDWCLAAGTKVLTVGGWRDVETITIHDQVLTPCGPRRILRSGIVRSADKWVSIMGVRCTPEHRFFTSRGLVDAGELSFRDALWTQGSLGLNILAFWCAIFRSGFKGAIISATQEARQPDAPCSFTEWSMRLLTAQFRRVMKSIMTMMTATTTTRTISSSSLALSTAANTNLSPDSFVSAAFADRSSAAIKTSAPGAARNAVAQTMPAWSGSGEPEPAYNLTVDVDECYFVKGDNGRAYLVSNSSHGSDALGLMCVAYEAPRSKATYQRLEVTPFGAA